MKILVYDSGIGALYFIKKILNKKINNQYYLYLDQDYFPLGNKDEIEIKKHLEELLDKLVNKFDLIIIFCNTMSIIYLKYFNDGCFKKKIKTIFEYNELLINKKSVLLGTSLFKKTVKIRNYSVNSLLDLALAIEEYNYDKILTIIKHLDDYKNYILCCTHYPFIISLLKQRLPNSRIVDGSSLLIDSLPNSSKLEIFCLKRNIKTIKKFLHLDGLKIYDL